MIISFMEFADNAILISINSNDFISSHRLTATLKFDR